MDDPNYKIKNIYSSVSPSEIALRCTILDLCQRLKRTEVLCDYYEQCRNELVSDCIRLRQERDYYLLAHRNSLQKSEVCKPPKNIPSNNNINTNNSNQITGPQVDANQLRQSNTKIQPSFSFEKEIDFSKTTEPDDNYEEIAKRLIAQFREEMEEIRRASMNIPQLQSASRNQNEIITAMSSHVSKGGRATTATNHSNDSSTMPTMLASSATTPAKQLSQQMIASNCDDINNQSKLLSDVPGCNSGKPLPPPSSSSPIGTNPVYLSKKMSTTINNPNDCGFEFERVSVHDILGDFQRGGGSGISKYYQSNHGITKRDSTSETLDKLPSPCEGSSSSTSAYNRNQQSQGHHHNSPNQHSQSTQYHQNRHLHVSNNSHSKEIADRHDLKDVPTVIEVNSNRHNYNPVGGRYDRSGDIVQQQQQEQQTGSSSNIETEYYIDFCSKILKSSINDFDTLTRMLMNQNEKLRKLKGKQLRSYFKRQLDQNNETSNIPKRT